MKVIEKGRITGKYNDYPKIIAYHYAYKSGNNDYLISIHKSIDSEVVHIHFDSELELEVAFKAISLSKEVT